MMPYIPTMGREYTREYSDKLKGVCAVVRSSRRRLSCGTWPLKDEGYNYSRFWEAE